MWHTGYPFPFSMFLDTTAFLSAIAYFFLVADVFLLFFELSDSLFFEVAVDEDFFFSAFFFLSDFKMLGLLFFFSFRFNFVFSCSTLMTFWYNSFL